MKHESHTRVCSASTPARSVVSSTVLQKHVGHTSVQLPQLRQRSATSSQRGCSALACSRSRMSVVSSVRPIEAARALDRVRRGLALVAAGGPVAHLGEDVGPALAADLDDEAVAVVVEDLGQRQVEAAGHARSGPHRRAEARPAGAPAVDRDEEGVAPARLVVGLDVAVAEEHAVLDRHGVQVAGAHADEGVARRRPRAAGPRARRRRRDARARPRTVGGNRNRLSESWPTVWANTRLVVAAAQAVANRPPGRRPSRRAGRRPTSARRRRSPASAPGGRSP